MKNCLIISNSFKKESGILAKEISVFLKNRGIDFKIAAYDGKNALLENFSGDFSLFDFVITLGGDGTVLFASRSCAPLGIPVFPVNFGEFGFLACIAKNSWQIELESFLRGNSFISERILVESEVLREGKTVFKCTSMNDCVISSVTFSRIVKLNVVYNRAFLGPFKTSGIIVATPTGSTAYSAATGGPIVEPSMEALILTPVSSFSLSARPLVFGKKGEIAITIMKNRSSVGLNCDGQIDFMLKENDVVILGISKYCAKLVGSTQEKFYAALQSKLNWAGGPRA